MRYLGDDEATQLRGIDLYQGTDGNLYEWVDGVDEWGEQELSEAEGPVLNGLGALYAAPDGTLYQMHGLAEEEAEGQEQPGPRAQGPRRPPGRPRPGVRGGAPRKKKKGGFFKKLLLPIAKFAAGAVPGAGPLLRAGIDIAEKALKKPGVAGYNGFGALYAAPDGSLFQVQGLAEEELRGFAEDEELKGFAADEELRGFAADEELRGLDADEELRGFAADEDLRGFAEDQAMQGIDGYVRQDGMSGLDAYLPQAPPRTPWFVAPTEPPEIWKPLW
jgi:hypothetical protein